MMRLGVKSWTFVCLLALALAAPAAIAQSGIKRLVIFGTSLSDAGNAYTLYGGVNTPPKYDVDLVTLVPPASSPYAKGGHHFSNGSTWIEQAARSLRLSQNANPALRSSNPRASNYAVGGARARAHDDDDHFNLPQQVQAFLDTLASGQAAPSDALYIIEMGANDISDALEVGAAGGEAAAAAILGDALTSIGNSVGALYSRGARKFLIWNAPDFGLTPAVQRLAAIFGPSVKIAASQLSNGFNTCLQVVCLSPAGEVVPGVIPSLSALPGIQIQVLDVFKKLNDVVDPNSHASFGLTNVTAACIAPNVPPFECQRPDEYLFWDGIHPTTTAHGILAEEALKLLR